MSSPDSDHEIAVTRLMQRLRGYALGLGLDEVAVRKIAERVIADMPHRPDEDRVAEAWNWMVIAAA